VGLMFVCCRKKEILAELITLQKSQCTELKFFSPQIFFLNIGHIEKNCNKNIRSKVDIETKPGVE
jgi:hypothetical protein